MKPTKLTNLFGPSFTFVSTYSFHITAHNACVEMILVSLKTIITLVVPSRTGSLPMLIMLTLDR